MAATAAVATQPHSARLKRAHQNGTPITFAFLPGWTPRQAAAYLTWAYPGHGVYARHKPDQPWRALPDLDGEDSTPRHWSLAHVALTKPAGTPPPADLPEPPAIPVKVMSDKVGSAPMTKLETYLQGRGTSSTEEDGEEEELQERGKDGTTAMTAYNPSRVRFSEAAPQAMTFKPGTSVAYMAGTSRFHKWQQAKQAGAACHRLPASILAKVGPDGPAHSAVATLVPGPEKEGVLYVKAGLPPASTPDHVAEIVRGVHLLHQHGLDLHRFALGDWVLVKEEGAEEEEELAKLANLSQLRRAAAEGAQPVFERSLLAPPTLELQRVVDQTAVGLGFTTPVVRLIGRREYLRRLAAVGPAGPTH